MGWRWLGSSGAVALLFVCSAVCAQAALAAPPANDDFANRESLSGSLPIEVSRSNVEATKESEEYLGSLFAAGHSVWFEWEATADGWVTIGGCEADFVDVLGVFTGSAVNGLTSVSSINGSEGPTCPFQQRQYTFDAESGTKYQIAVDGNPFHLPEAPAPDTEGSFQLRIELTPPPANDDFSDATALVSDLEEEEGGETFYWGSAFGYNWGATEEGGEPDHVGGPHGASVWYAWTAPLSGQARINGIFSADQRLGVYTGGSLGALQLLFGGPGGSNSFVVQAGTTYRIAVYGLRADPGDPPYQGSFQLHVLLHGPTPPPPGGDQGTHPGANPPPPDTKPPQTTISKRIIRPLKRLATFSFQSDEVETIFRCRLDARKSRLCSSPQTFRNLAPGKHKLSVTAVDAAGNVDPSPAVAHFTIPPKLRHGTG